MGTTCVEMGVAMSALQVYAEADAPIVWKNAITPNGDAAKRER
ncbi:MAG: hypothetical protein WD669_05155 [Pirellulales bacterium]